MYRRQGRHRLAWLVTCALGAILLSAGTPATNPAGRPGQASPGAVGGCALFPADNIWNVRVDHLPIHTRSDQYVAAIGLTANVHADFGSGTWNGGPIGIPYVVVPGDQPGVPVTFEYADESDPGLYPIPVDAPIEGGPQSEGDRHVLIVDRDRCRLYELYAAYPQSDGTWSAGSGAMCNCSDLQYIE